MQSKKLWVFVVLSGLGLCATSELAQGQTLANVKANFTNGPPEKSAHQGQVNTPNGAGAAGTWQIVVTYGKWTPVAGGAKRWDIDPAADTETMAVIIAQGDFAWGPRAPAPILAGGVAAGRITHMLIRLEKWNGAAWVPQDTSDVPIMGAAGGGNGGN